MRVSGDNRVQDSPVVAGASGQAKMPQAAASAAATVPVWGTDSRDAAPTPDLTGLTTEEAQFVTQGFLPANFAALRETQREKGLDATIAQARKGIKGPFSRGYGNPDAMLSAARRWAKNPELARLVTSIQPGDILVTSWNKDDDVISKATKGPFIHAAICVSAGAPPTFIEAIGLTGDMSDTASNKVLRTEMLDHGYNGETVRVLRPAATLSPLEADKAVKRAIAYAEKQLGKPYDFAFTETNGRGWNDAFYCSELAYKAYTDKVGAGLPLPIDKAGPRDVTLAAVGQILGDLGVDDPGKLAFRAAQLSTDKNLDTDKLVDFLVDEVAIATETTRRLADTPERKVALRKVLTRALAGNVFVRLQGALAHHGKAEGAGQFKGIGGFFKRVGSMTGIVVSAVKDAYDLTKDIGFWRSLSVSIKLARTVTPHLDVLAKFFFGPNDPRTKTATEVLNNLDGLSRDASHIPLLGKLWPLPSRPAVAENRDFISPTDLGWANLPHEDFNVKPDHPIEKAEVQKRNPAYLKG